VLSAPCIVVSIPLAPKREVPGSTSGRFAYTGDQASLVSSYCRYASAAGSLYCVYNTGSQREVSGTTSGRFAYTRDQASLVSCCRYASAAGSLYCCVYTTGSQKGGPWFYLRQVCLYWGPGFPGLLLLQVCQCCRLPVMLCLYHRLPKERSLVLPQAELPILGTRHPWSPPTVGMAVLAAPCIVVSVPLAPKREDPGSTSGRFAYTGDQASLVSTSCRYASAAGSL
jgi:hypothetical protein